MSFTTREKTTDGREYVAIFGDPNSTTPTDRYTIAPDGKVESEWHKSPVWCAACGKWGDHGSGTCPTIPH